jgi:hypothetical protein
VAKQPCPISRPDFLSKSTPLTVVIDGHTLSAAPKDFKTGSFGWFLNGKLSLQVGGVTVPVQVSANLTVVGSKELPREDTPAPAKEG